MRGVSLIIMAAVAGQPAPGVYCGSDGGGLISVGPAPGEIGIDGQDCQGGRVTGGKLKDARCYTNSFTDRGSPYETDLVVREDGSLGHADMVFRRLKPGEMCR